MPLHAQAQAVIDAIAALGQPPIEEQTPDEARALRAAMWRASPEPIAETRDLDADGVPVRWYRPEVTHSDGVLVWLHGGGWVIGNLDSHDDLCRSIANRAGCVVVSVEYRLAPETSFPGPLDDCRTALAWVAAHADELGIDADAIAIGGDSAGGNLAAVLANEGGTPLVGQVLIYPVVDGRMGHASYTENGEGLFLTKAGMGWFYDHYLQGHDPTDVAVSPLLDTDERLAASPPALVITAEYDPLRDEAEEYAGRLADLGVPTTFVRVNGQIHGFFSMFGLLDDCRSTQAFAAEHLRTLFARSGT